MSFLRIIIHKPTNTERGGTFTTIYTKQQRSTAPFKAFASHSSALCRKNSLIVTPADLCNHWLHSVVIMVEQVELARVWIGNITLTIT